MWILIWLLQGGAGENGALRGAFFMTEEECKPVALEKAMDPDVLAASDCTRMLLVPTQVKRPK